MKRIITICMLLLISITYSQESQEVLESTIQTTEVERIVDKYSSKIAESFSTFMETAAPLAQEGFIVVVNLQIAKGIVMLLPLLAFIIFMYLSFREYNKTAAELKQENIPEYLNARYGPLDESNVNIKVLGTFILAGITFIMACLSTLDGVTHLIAPEWYAILEISKSFK